VNFQETSVYGNRSNNGEVMSIDQIASEVMHLDPKSRAVLAKTIWESLEDPYVIEEMSDQEAIQLAKRRDDEIERGEVVPLSHDELMAKVRGNEG
jgi:putative addiction module component (TIGR02574 family)